MVSLAKATSRTHLAILDAEPRITDRVPPSWEVERERFLRGLGVE
jgi:hypothetical protein